MGSTRLKAGTAQKMVLNMITTGVMVRVGRTFDNLMTDMRITNAKLSEPKRIIAGLNTKIEFQCGLYIDPKDGSNNVLDRRSGELTARVASSTGGYFRRARCALEKPR